MTIRTVFASVVLTAFAATTFTYAPTAQADRLLIEKVRADASKKLPRRGMSKTQVSKHFGEPNSISPAVGGNKPQHPPITRWHYTGFTVYFERNHVIDTVVRSGDPVAP